MGSGWLGLDWRGAALTQRGKRPTKSAGDLSRRREQARERVRFDVHGWSSRGHLRNLVFVVLIGERVRPEARFLPLRCSFECGRTARWQLRNLCAPFCEHIGEIAKKVRAVALARVRGWERVPSCSFFTPLFFFCFFAVFFRVPPYSLEL